MVAVPVGTIEPHGVIDRSGAIDRSAATVLAVMTDRREKTDRHEVTGRPVVIDQRGAMCQRGATDLSAATGLSGTSGRLGPIDPDETIARLGMIGLGEKVPAAATPVRSGRPANDETTARIVLAVTTRRDGTTGTGGTIVHRCGMVPVAAIGDRSRRDEMTDSAATIGHVGMIVRRDSSAGTGANRNVTTVRSAMTGRSVIDRFVTTARRPATARAASTALPGTTGHPGTIAPPATIGPAGTIVRGLMTGRVGTIGRGVTIGRLATIGLRGSSATPAGTTGRRVAAATIGPAPTDTGGAEIEPAPTGRTAKRPTGRTAKRPTGRTGNAAVRSAAISAKVLPIDPVAAASTPIPGRVGTPPRHGRVVMTAGTTIGRSVGSRTAAPGFGKRTGARLGRSCPSGQ